MLIMQNRVLKGFKGGQNPPFSFIFQGKWELVHKGNLLILTNTQLSNMVILSCWVGVLMFALKYKNGENVSDSVGLLISTL